MLNGESIADITRLGIRNLPVDSQVNILLINLQLLHENLPSPYTNSDLQMSSREKRAPHEN
jgi:hypothetical protein